mmetsp:Transcript_23871/g.52790  ORF Transcript_23871/g.52790 Transcript_23871/m.52790 type:complete len:238 (+) Transcript_23871:390-1103(+)
MEHFQRRPERPPGGSLPLPPIRPPVHRSGHRRPSLDRGGPHRRVPPAPIDRRRIRRRIGGRKVHDGRPGPIRGPPLPHIAAERSAPRRHHCRGPENRQLGQRNELPRRPPEDPGRGQGTGHRRRRAAGALPQRGGVQAPLKAGHPAPAVDRQQQNKTTQDPCRPRREAKQRSLVLLEDAGVRGGVPRGRSQPVAQGPMGLPTAGHGTIGRSHDPGLRRERNLPLCQRASLAAGTRDR